MKLRLHVVIALFCFIFTAVQAQQSYDVNFRTHTYSPTENRSSFNPSDVSKKEVFSGRYYRFIQFNDVLRNDDFNDIKSKGIELLSYIPTNTYLVSIPVQLTSADFKELDFRSIWEVGSELKKSSDVLNKSLPEWAIEGGDALLVAKYYEDLPQDLVIHHLEKEGVRINANNGVNNYLSIAVDLDKVDELIELPFIQFVEPIQAPPVKDDRRGRSLHRVNRLDANLAGDRRYTGKGINVLVRDDGAVFDHIDFKGRLNQNFAGTSFGSHGDGVAGIMAGNGNLNPVNQGMAHESTVHVVNYRADFLGPTMGLFNNQDVIVTNSSYSDGCNRGYTQITQTVDQQTFDNPTLMHVFSAGNAGQGGSDGQGNIFECGYGAGLTWANITGGHKQGKNVIATGNVNFRGEIMASSSRGPAYDGRIKPDITANGNNHVSTDETQGYFNFSGTSGAAPVVAGVMAMLHEAYEVLFGERANAALLKAAMLNTATDLGNKGPDFIYGWGNLNAHRAALCLEEQRFMHEQIQQDENKEHTITVPENVAEVRVMVYWPDPEGFEQAAISLLNDLNTRLIGPDGSTNMPWVLDHSPDPILLNTPATKGVDFLNNMEQIAIDNPDAGEYTLQVDGDLVPFGTNDYYVVWEFRMNEIDIIFPYGGENLNALTTEIIHWDATGNEGVFVITHIDADGNEVQIGQVNGDQRLFQWFTPNQFSEKSKIRVSRDGLSGESAEPFLLANNPRNLEVTFEDREPVWLHWDSDTIPVSYNIYRLGEFVMEKIETIEADSFLIPNEPEYKYTFLAVSANFPDGTEGKRSIAISTTPKPIALATNDQNDKPCVFMPVVYETQSTDTLLRYRWSFGANVSPEEAFTEGPHTVFYTTKGPNLAVLNIENDGGSDDFFFILNVQEELEAKDTEVTDEGEGNYIFKSKINGANEYIWDFGDGNMGSGKTVMHTFTSPGVYTVQLDAVNSCGTVTEFIEILFDVTDVEDLTENDFVLSPNPSFGDFEITLPDLEGNELNVQLISVNGKLIDQKRFNNTTTGQKIYWDNIPQGVYILKFEAGSKKLNKRVIVH